MARPERYQVEPGLVIFRRGYRDGRRCSTWTIRAHVDGHCHEKPTGRRDRKAAEAAAIRFRNAKERRLEGVDDWGDAEDAPIAKLLVEWRAEQLGRGLAVGSVTNAVRRARDVLATSRALADATTLRIRMRLDELAQTARASASAPKAKQARRGFGASTKNSYRAAASGFFAWLVGEGRWGTNPVDAVKVAKATKKRVRRPLALPELVKVASVAPLDRAACYLLAASAGFRRSETKRVIWSHLTLEGLPDGIGALWLAAASAKNRREATQPLPPAVVEILRAYRAALASGAIKPPSAARPRPSWRDTSAVVTPPKNGTFRADLEAAGIDWRDQGRGCVDFHSLRGALATGLADLGVHVHTTKELMRHSNVELTLGSYTTVWDASRRDAVLKLGGALAAVPGAVLRSTRTGRTKLPEVASEAGPKSAPPARPRTSKNAPKSRRRSG